MEHKVLDEKSGYYNPRLDSNDKILVVGVRVSENFMRLLKQLLEKKGVKNLSEMFRKFAINEMEKEGLIE